MSFTSRVGESNGVYKNIAKEKNGAHLNMTIQCSVCGRSFVRSNNRLHNLDLSQCICDRLEKSKKYQINRLKGRTVTDQYYSRCKSQFKAYLKQKLAQNPDIKYDDFDKIWEAVGPKPQDTEFCKYYLTRKGRGRKNPNFTADNMEWHKITTSKAIAVAQNALPGKTRRTCRSRAEKAKDATSINAFMNQVSMAEKVMRSEEEYRYFVGRKIRSYRIISVEKSNKYGKSEYFFTMKCDRCGRVVYKTASKVLRERNKCLCVSNTGHNFKNSSASAGSKLTRQKYRQFIRSTKHSFTQDELLLLQAHLSEYSLYAGSPEQIEASCEIWFGGENFKDWICDNSLRGT